MVQEQPCQEEVLVIPYSDVRVDAQLDLKPETILMEKPLEIRRVQHPPQEMVFVPLRPLEAEIIGLGERSIMEAPSGKPIWSVHILPLADR